MKEDINAIKQAAESLCVHATNNGFKRETIYRYRNKNGEIIYYRIRLKHPNGSKKFFPMHQNQNGKCCLGEPPEFKDSPKPLYGLYLLAKNPEATVIIVEGEKATNALNQFFSKQSLDATYVTITSGGASSAKMADWAPLSNRKCIIWPDNDEPGIKYAHEVFEQLNNLKCKTEILDLRNFNLPEGADCVEWLQIDPTYTIKDFLSIPYDKSSYNKSKSSEDKKSNKQKTNQTTEIIKFISQHSELVHDKNKAVFVIDKATNEVWKVKSHQFRDSLMMKFFDCFGKSIREQSFKEALYHISGMGRNGECRTIYRRIAKQDDCYYLDLCWLGNSKAIKIVPGKWDIIDKPPILFLRSETMQPLPEPKCGGSLDMLWSCCNIPKNSQLLALSWILESLRPDTPYPILELLGEQGSAKSTTQAILRRVIDPNACDLRAAPKQNEDLFVSAGANHVVSCENISYLQSSMQDALCVISTGAGYHKRKLFSDADELIIYANNPVIINGINASITNQDLIDRAITIELPSIIVRTDVTKLRSTFENNSSLILGALLDVFAKSLTILPDIKLPPGEKPRLIEFFIFGMAIAEAIGFSGKEFINQFTESRQESIARTIDASPVATAFIDWWEKKQLKVLIELPVKTLFNEVAWYRNSNNMDSWPKSPKGFADALRRVAPALRQYANIDCQCLGKKGSNVHWRIS